MTVRIKEVYLEEFAGTFSIVLDCREVLYGRDMEINLDNVQVLLKFGFMKLS